MRALDTIHRNAMAQVRIVDDVLDISRIVRGTLHLSAQPMRLAPLLSLAVESISPTAEAKGVSLTSSIAQEPVEVWGDPDRLQQIFWNLLSNAVKFTSSGDRIDVSMQREGDQVSVRISDTGAGIAPEFLPHVFERFRQGDGSSTRTHGGLGLGLSIVRQLVELHGGTMRVESRGAGQGSSFTVCLPVHTARRRSSPPPMVPPRKHKRALDLHNVHVLIVDDQADARELLRAMLAGTGARISEAAAAEQALQLIAADRPDILLADVAMPRRDGYSMMREVRASPQGAQIRAIAVSAYARREDKSKALAEGFDDHVAKPVHPDELMAAIERLCRQPPHPLTPDADSDASVH
jgi:CheY-like chemotaxis protein/two-component sensor histidine kinase